VRLATHIGATPGAALVVVLAALIVVATPAEVRAQQVSVDIQMTATPAAAAVGESITLRIRADVSGAQPQDIQLPDLSAFRVTSRRVSRPMQFSFGFGSQTQVVRSTIAYDLTISPLNAGRHQIAPAAIEVGGRTYRSEPVTIEVRGGGGATPPGGPTGPGAMGQQVDPRSPPTGTLDGATYDDQAFLRTTVSTSEPHVGEQVTVTVYLYVRGSIRAAPVIQREPNADGFWVHDLLPANRTLEAQRQMVGGVYFNVYALRRFAAFPLSEGEHEIGPMSIAFETGSLFDIFSTQRSGPVRRVGVSMPVHVLPLPATGRPTGEVSVGDFTIDARLDRTAAATGDAVTLTAEIKGTGNLKDVRLTLPERPGVRILEPEVTDAITSPNDVVGGSRTFAWLVVPEEPGQHQLGPLILNTYSPSMGTYRRVSSAPLTLDAAGSAIAGATPSPEDDAAEASSEARLPQLGPIRTGSELLRNAEADELPTWLAAALAVPPLLYAIFLVFGLARRRLEEKGIRDAPARIARGARKRLTTAEGYGKDGDAQAFYGEIQKVLKDVLEARLGEAVGGFTHRALEEHLKSRGMDDDLSRRVVDELEGSEFARFSAEGAAPEEIGRCSERVAALIERMDRFTPPQEELR